MKLIGFIPLALLASQLPAQEGLKGFDLAFEIGGEAQSDAFGKAVCGIGDIDGDLFGDFLVGADFYDSGVLDDAGAVYAYSGVDGSLLYRIDGTSKQGKFGGDISPTGDVDGDGIGDFIVGARFMDTGNARDSGAALVYSGATGDLIYQIQGTKTNTFFGISVAGIGDVNLDGVPDFAIGERGAVSSGGSNPGWVRLYSGSDGQAMFSFQADISGDLFGDEIAPIGDVNGDGAPDILVGAPGIGAAFLYSGADGTQIRVWDSFPAGSDAGSSMASIGDLNGDGLPDVLIGEPSHRNVYIYETGTGQLIGTLTQTVTYDKFGVAVSSAGDIDLDGKEDILVGANMASPAGTQTGCAFVYSSGTGFQLKRFDGKTNQGQYGASVAVAGDLNRDGLPDLIMGSKVGDFGGITDAGYIEAFLTKHYMTVTALNSAPGPVGIELAFADPDSRVAFFYGQPGSSTVPVPGCGPVDFDLASPFLDRIMLTGPTGRVNFVVQVPGIAVGWGIQVVNLEDCGLSNLLVL